MRAVCGRAIATPAGARPSATHSKALRPCADCSYISVLRRSSLPSSTAGGCRGGGYICECLLSCLEGAPAFALGDCAASVPASLWVSTWRLPLGAMPAHAAAGRGQSNGGGRWQLRGGIGPRKRGTRRRFLGLYWVRLPLRPGGLGLRRESYPLNCTPDAIPE